MKLTDTLALSAATTGIRVVCGLLINKLVAVLLGPAGIAVIGQTQNFLTVMSQALTIGMPNALVNRLAVAPPDGERRALFKLLILLVTATVTAAVIGIFLLRQWLPDFFLIPNTSPLLLAALLASCLPFLALYSTLTAVLNGDRRTRAYFAALSLTPLTMLPLTALAVSMLGPLGVLVGFCASYAITAAVCLRFGVLRVSWRTILQSAIPDSTQLRTIRNLCLMSVVAAIVAPVCAIVIRSMLAFHVDAESAGLWDGIQRISDAYLMPLMVPMAAYFLPAFSRTTESAALSREMWRGLLMIAVALPLLAGTVFLLRDWLVALLFTERFAPISSLIHLQLFADFFRMIGWLFGYFLLAREATRIFVSAELGAGFVQVVSASILIPERGISGAIIAYWMGYVLYALASGLAVFMHLRRRACA
jgi:PST family polysaccharide transporter